MALTYNRKHLKWMDKKFQEEKYQAQKAKDIEPLIYMVKNSDDKTVFDEFKKFIDSKPRDERLYWSYCCGYTMSLVIGLMVEEKKLKEQIKLN